jgi:hypothetical protein
MIEVEGFGETCFQSSSRLASKFPYVNAAY